MNRIFAFVFVLVFVVLVSNCGLGSKLELPFGVVAAEKDFDNARGAKKSPLSFRGLVFENTHAYQQFLQERAAFPSSGLGLNPGWSSKYAHIVDTVDTQTYLLIMVIQEDDELQPTDRIRIEGIQAVGNTLEVNVYVPEPRPSPCESIFVRIFGGVICHSTLYGTNTFQMVAVSRTDIPVAISSITFINQHGIHEEVYNLPTK